ncbi:hypothetical protein B0T25DRAFT_546461 [Lasiosphaeria hispida]|uniref:C3H1-type domain-containing protein n=1 Tax=Lasiosphaeria hispida TaxID=260671 RepID=A0AAJ0MC31_9PEZI|nr:hypothetical protein B0T25DRAFT_546461 [Lasiosphaeria hispida]
MAICKFFVQGFCRNGSACRFEHPGKQTQSQPAGNRFNALSGSSSQAMGNRQGELPYNLNPETIRHDLSEDVPTWILSAYGPGKLAPAQLFGGYPREQSFEEVRMHYLQGVAAGNEQGALAEIEALYQNAKQQINHTLHNMDSAIQFIVDAGTKHPNRNDICQQSTPTGGTTGEFSRDKLAPGGAFGSTANAFQATPVMPTVASNPFGAPAATPSPFGQPAALGQKPNPFGAPAFSQPATTPAFGQPAAMGGTNAFGQPAQPSAGFGQPSTIGAKPNPFGAPAFGQPAQPAGPAFGQPSQPTTTAAFGQPSQPANAFGQPAALGQKPNPFGAPANAPSPFGAPAAPAQPAANPFGQPAQPAQAPSGFGQPAANPFGQPATTGGFSQPAPAVTNAFGQLQPQASAFQNGAPPTASAAPNLFGQPATNNAFGSAPTKPAANPFGQPAAAPANPFGQPSAPQPAAAPANLFGQPAQPAAAAANPFGQPSQPAAAPFGNAAAPRPSGGPNPYGPNATRQHPDIMSYAGKEPDGRLHMFKGKPVSYVMLGASKDAKELPVVRSFDGTATRIWFPDGPPNYSAETEAEDQAYADPEVLRKWKVFVDTGRFEGGMMPEVPPKREFCAWDF